jgi:hypothetical protein
MSASLSDLPYYFQRTRCLAFHIIVKGFFFEEVICSALRYIGRYEYINKYKLYR